MLMTTTVEWHDLTIDPEDMPSADEEIFVTVEAPDGERMVWSRVFYDEESECWCTYEPNEYGSFVLVPVWYTVIGWAYNPEPMPEIVRR